MTSVNQVNVTQRVAAHGVSVGIASGWECRIHRRDLTHADERTNAVVHLANFALPERRDDFGGGVTTSMRSSDAFVVLFEYGPESAGTALFRAQGVPRVTAAMFASKRLQRPLPGQLGCQLFFTVNGRPFCLYVVAGSRAYVPRVVAEVNAMLDALDVGG